MQSLKTDDPPSLAQLATGAAGLSGCLACVSGSGWLGGPRAQHGDRFAAKRLCEP